MSLILNLETSTTICSVSLSDNDTLIAVKEDANGRNHASLLTVFIEDILKKAGIKPEDLNAIAVSKGPGSYTGLRIGVSVAKGLAYGLKIPLIAIDTLEMMAKGYRMENPELEKAQNILLCPMIDARRMEVYSAIFDSTGKQIREVRAEIIDETSFDKELKTHRLYFFGDGAAKCSTVLRDANLVIDEVFRISSRFMIPFSWIKFEQKHFEDVAYFEPFYLKDFIATIPKNKMI